MMMMLMMMMMMMSYINGIRVVLLGPPSFLNGLLMHGTIFHLTLTFHHPSPLNVKKYIRLFEIMLLN